MYNSWWRFLWWRESLVVWWLDTKRIQQFHINNFIYSPVNIKYRNQIQLSEYISCTRGLTYLQGGSRVSILSRISSQEFNSPRVAAPFPREKKKGESFSFVGAEGAATRRLGFQVMLRICLAFPVKISSHQSPIFAVPAMEDYWTRASQAPYGWNVGNFATKITTKERDDSMVKFRQYIWSAYLVFLFFVRLPLVHSNNLHLPENGRAGLKLGCFTFTQTTRVEIFWTNIKL